MTIFAQKMPRKCPNSKPVQKQSVTHQIASIFGTESTHEFCLELCEHKMVQLGHKCPENGQKMPRKCPNPKLVQKPSVTHQIASSGHFLTIFWAFCGHFWAILALLLFSIIELWANNYII